MYILTTLEFPKHNFELYIYMYMEIYMDLPVTDWAKGEAKYGGHGAHWEALSYVDFSPPARFLRKHENRVGGLIPT